MQNNKKILKHILIVIMLAVSINTSVFAADAEQKVVAPETNVVKAESDKSKSATVTTKASSKISPPAKIISTNNLVKQDNKNIITIDEKLTQQIKSVYSFLDDFKINLDDQNIAKDTQINPDDYAAIYLESGILILHLYPGEVPKTVAAFRTLVRSGFYNGLTFYHVIPNYIMQTGDPSESGYGGYGQFRKAEISKKLKFVRGTVAMANSGNLNSDDTQFFISFNQFPWLNSHYTIFADIVAGMGFLENYTPSFDTYHIINNPLTIDKIVILSDLPKFRPKNKQFKTKFNAGGPLITSGVDLTKLNNKAPQSIQRTRAIAPQKVQLPSNK